MVNQANNTDVTIINSGTYRIDSVIPVGFINTGHVMDILPMLDPIMVAVVNGEQLHRLLENGVSSWPEYQGKFPSLAGVKFIFDGEKEPGNRIDKDDIYVKGAKLDYEKEYTVDQWKELICWIDK